MELSLEIAGDQIAGARDYQEDAFLTTYLDDESGESKSSALIVVADGMGGHAAGNIASNLVTSTLNKAFTAKFGKQEPPDVLRKALKDANEGLMESIQETPGLDGMGCTMVTAAISRGKIYWISVGDSHLYLIRDRELTKKNEDHSYGGYLDRMRSQGIDVEAEAGLSRNMLMSAMTGGEIAEVDCPDTGYQLLPGDRLIIASDGLDTLESEIILKTSAWSHTPKECVAALLNAVDEAKRPRQDNTTIVVADLVERQPAESQVPAPAPAAPVAEVAPVPVIVAPARDWPIKTGGGNKGLIFFLILLLGIGAGGYVYMAGMWREWLPTDLARIPPQPVQPQPVQPQPVQPQPVQPQPVQPQPVQPQPVQPQPVQPQPVQPQPVQPQPAQPQPAQPQPVQPQPVQPEPVQSVQPAQPEPIPPAPVRKSQDTLKSGGMGPVMVQIPAGSFEMGSPDHSLEATERPKRTVEIPAFAMGKHEVTFAEYERFARATGRKLPKNSGQDKNAHPVVLVSWDDALAYTKWLSSQTGKNYRLPTEAQWEYAALGNRTTRYWWGRQLGSGRAHCFDCDTGLDPRSPTGVARFPANDFGLHDTAGNVAEWVRDCWHPDYRDAPTDGSAWEGGDCSYRVARGGSYVSPGKSIRAKKRSKWKPQRGYDSVGFRVVREL